MSKKIDVFNNDIGLTCSIIIESELKNQNKEKAMENLKELQSELEDADMLICHKLHQVRDTLKKVKQAYYEIKEDSNLLK